MKTPSTSSFIVWLRLSVHFNSFVTWRMKTPSTSSLIVWLRLRSTVRDGSWRDLSLLECVSAVTKFSFPIILYSKTISWAEVGVESRPDCSKSSASICMRMSRGRYLSRSELEEPLFGTFPPKIRCSRSEFSSVGGRAASVHGVCLLDLSGDWRVVEFGRRDQGRKRATKPEICRRLGRANLNYVLLLGGGQQNKSETLTQPQWDRPSFTSVFGEVRGCRGTGEEVVSRGGATVEASRRHHDARIIHNLFPSMVRTHRQRRAWLVCAISWPCDFFIKGFEVKGLRSLRSRAARFEHVVRLWAPMRSRPEGSGGQDSGDVIRLWALGLA